MDFFLSPIRTLKFGLAALCVSAAVFSACTSPTGDAGENDAGASPCAQACGDVENCEAIYGLRTDEEGDCYERVLAACDRPQPVPDALAPMESPDGDCFVFVGEVPASFDDGDCSVPDEECGNAEDAGATE